ncbi:expressed unknown protein [Seminavis robusta]|uniref:Uncharacterized protein n=1 Tax=Seminavis robusta TaxID=568900 RepID=A0A9N8HFR3_9STRA|nr:expressed unknown protein [Seminavis robusta]|eukprot:Sro587_g171360.1 n/a (421) ;mRNA; f:44692-45954
MVIRNSSEWWRAAAFCIVFFLLGVFTAPHNNKIIHPTNKQHDDNDDPQTTSVQEVMARHAKAQKQLLAEMDTLQHPAVCGRRLRLQSRMQAAAGTRSEQFARDFQYAALALQVAVATQRMLVLEGEWVCHDTDARGHQSGISCLAAISSCTTHDDHTHTTTSNPHQDDDANILDPLSFGIIPDQVITDDNALFHADYYGSSKQEMEMPSWPYPKSTYLIDVVPTWERAFGRFWVRAQMAHYLWGKWHSANNKEEEASQKTTKPYIVLYWISSRKMRKNLATKYGRDASITQAFERCMEIVVQNILLQPEQQPSKSSLDTIYIVTDGVVQESSEGGAVLPPETLEQDYPEWKFVRRYPATNEDEKLLSDLELMRRADFLVGSFQSQMFRLATELNTAWFTGRYPPAMKRHWPVDVEWFENP